MKTIDGSKFTYDQLMRELKTAFCKRYNIEITGLKDSYFYKCIKAYNVEEDDMMAFIDRNGSNVILRRA